MKNALTLPLASFADILAQAPVVSAAFGRGLGFTLMMTALFGAFSLGGLAILSLFWAAMQLTAS
jgi:hypothetical protein